MRWLVGPRAWALLSALSGFLCHDYHWEPSLSRRQPVSWWYLSWEPPPGWLTFTRNVDISTFRGLCTHPSCVFLHLPCSVYASLLLSPQLGGRSSQTRVAAVVSDTARVLVWAVTRASCDPPRNINAFSPLPVSLRMMSILFPAALLITSDASTWGSLFELAFPPVVASLTLKWELLPLSSVRRVPFGLRLVGSWINLGGT